MERSLKGTMMNMTDEEMNIEIFLEFLISMEAVPSAGYYLKLLTTTTATATI